MDKQKQFREAEVIYFPKELYLIWLTREVMIHVSYKLPETYGYKRDYQIAGTRECWPVMWTVPVKLRPSLTFEFEFSPCQFDQVKICWKRIIFVQILIERVRIETQNFSYIRKFEFRMMLVKHFYLVYECASKGI